MSRHSKKPNKTAGDVPELTMESLGGRPSDEQLLDALEGRCVIRLGGDVMVGKGTKKDISRFRYALEHGFLPAGAEQPAQTAYFIASARDSVALLRVRRRERDPLANEEVFAANLDLEISPPPGAVFRTALLNALAGILFDFSDELYFSPERVIIFGVSENDADDITGCVRLLASNPNLLEDMAAEDGDENGLELDDDEGGDLDGLDDEDDPFGPDNGGKKTIQ